MAFKGGFYRKPVNIDFDGVVGLYTAGKARAEQTREGVRKERGEQLKLLSEASDFEISGIEDFDQLIQGTANNARSVLLDAHKANIAGEGTRSMSAAETSNQSTQMQLLGKMSEMTAKKIEETKKLVEKGEASQAQLDNIYATFFQDEGQKLVITDADGKQRTADRTLTPVMMKDSRGRIKHGVKVKQEYVDQDGSLRQFEGFSSIADIVNPRDNFIKQKTVISGATEILDIFGKREFVVNSQGVQVPNPLYNQVASGPNGERFFLRPIAPEMFADVRNTVENNIANLSENDYVAMIKSMGGGTITDAGFKGYRPVDQVNQAYGGLYDENGNGIAFASDPLVIMRNEDMSYNVTEDNKKVVDAYIRDNVYKGMDVTSEELRTGALGRRGGTVEEESFPLGQLDVQVYDPAQQKTVAQEIDADYVLGVLSSEILLTEIGKGNATNNTAINAYNQWVTKGVLPSTAATGNSTQAQNILANNQGDMSGTIVNAKSWAGFDAVDKQLLGSLTSFGGYEFETVRGLIAVNTGDRVTIHAIGDVESSSMENALKAGGGTNAAAVVNKLALSQVKKTTAVSGNMSTSDLRTLWQKTYKSNASFARKANEIAKDLGQTNGYDIKLTTVGGNSIGIHGFWELMLED
jgi:hypothetical protein